MSSISMAVVEFVLRLQGKKSTRSEAAFRDRYEGRDYPASAPIPRSLQKNWRVEQRQVEGCTVFTMTAGTGASTAHIIYTHGGAYVNALNRHHWNIIRQLVKRTGATVTVPLYPLAPEHTYEAAYGLLERVYRDVTAIVPAGQVVLCGDSAGGGLALGQALHYRDLDFPLPGRIIMFSPWLDVTMSNPQAITVEDKDVMLTLTSLVRAGRSWAGKNDPRSPLVSPLFGDLSGLPPIDVFQGTHDVLIADARKLKEAVTAAGGTINLHEYPGAFHVFVAATFTPEARDVFEKVAQGVSALDDGA